LFGAAVAVNIGVVEVIDTGIQRGLDALRNSSSSTLAQPLGCPLTQFSPPMVQQPKLISDTLTSLVPQIAVVHELCS
jgi:hypothetical protein